MSQTDKTKTAGGATSYIRRIHQAVDADTELVKMFFDELWHFAESQIGEHLQHRVGPSDIANAALHSALREVKKKGAEEWSTERFRRLAKKIARHKILDQADKHRMQMRDVKRESDSFEGQTEEVSAGSDDPAERAAARELAVRWASEAITHSQSG
jgi:hypothetical protein